MGRRVPHPGPWCTASPLDRRLITCEQRIAERHAAHLLALARLARYRADRAAAVEAGQPLPPPPLIDERDIDLAAFERLLAEIAAHVKLERRRAAGLLTAQSEAVADDRAWSGSILAVLPHALAALDRSVAAGLTPAGLAALVATAAPPPDAGINQKTTHSAELNAAKQPPRSDSPRHPGEKSNTTSHLPATGANDAPTVG